MPPRRPIRSLLFSGQASRLLYVRFSSEVRSAQLLGSEATFKAKLQNVGQKLISSKASSPALNNGFDNFRAGDPIDGKPGRSATEAEGKQYWQPPQQQCWRDKSMRNRSVIITGGTSGIGRAVAQRCIQEQASRAVIVSRSLQRANDVIQDIKKDICMPHAPLEAYEFYLKSGGEIDNSFFNIANFSPFNTLINCAGTSQSSLAVLSGAEEIRDILEANLVQRFSLWQKASKSTSGATPPTTEPLATAVNTSTCIVNVSSLLAVRGGVGATAYAASKAAVTAFSRSLVAESGQVYKEERRTGPPIRINTVVPGLIQTPMLTRALASGGGGGGRGGGGTLSALQKDIPLGRVGEAEEVADAIMFLCQNEYANNCVLNLDGGLSAV